MRGVSSSPSAQEILRTREKDRRRNLETALASMLATPDGRLVLRWIFSAQMTGLTASTFVEDSNRTVFLEGRRSVAIDLLNALEQVKSGAYADLVADDRVAAKEDVKFLDSAKALAEGDEDD